MQNLGEQNAKVTLGWASKNKPCIVLLKGDVSMLATLYFYRTHTLLKS